MKVIDKKTIALWKKPNAILPKIDYTMNTKYYRVIDKGETLGASVDPLEALKLMVGNKEAELQEVVL